MSGLLMLLSFLLQRSIVSFAPHHTTTYRRPYVQTLIHQWDSNNEDVKVNNQDPRKSEFSALGNLPQSSKRKLRIEKEMRAKERFVTYGNEMWDLNDRIKQLSQALLDSIAEKGGENSDEIRERLREQEQSDPNIVYGLELEKMERALESEDLEEAQVHRELALEAREHLAQYNYQGLWIGK